MSFETDLRDRLRDAADHVEVDASALASIERRAARIVTRRRLTAAIAAAAALVVAAAIGAEVLTADRPGPPAISDGDTARPPATAPAREPGQGVETPAPVAPPPSQSAADAARDGVVPAVAALPFDERVSPRTYGLVPRVVTAEGVWVASEIPQAEDRWTVGDVEGTYGYDFVGVTEYAEILLLDPTERRILRAYPLPDVPPSELAVSDDAVYCAGQGDGAVSTSVICRIDRRTGAWSVRAFPSSIDPYIPLEGRLPDNLAVDAPVEEPMFGPLVLLPDVVVTVGDQALGAFDPVTLEPLDPAAHGIVRHFGTLVEVDGSGRVLTVNEARWLSGDEAREAYFEETGDDSGPPNDYVIVDEPGEPLTFRVADPVTIHMPLFWNTTGTPSDRPVRLEWDVFAGLWGDDAVDGVADHAVESARRTYYWLVVDDGEIVWIEGQYRP